MDHGHSQLRIIGFGIDHILIHFFRFTTIILLKNTIIWLIHVNINIISATHTCQSLSAAVNDILVLKDRHANQRHTHHVVEFDQITPTMATCHCVNYYTLNNYGNSRKLVMYLYFTKIIILY